MQPECPVCGRETELSGSWDFHSLDDKWIEVFPFDCAFFCHKCDVGITRDGVLLRKVDHGGKLVSAGVGKGGRIIFIAGPGDSERNLEILYALEEERNKFSQHGDLSSSEARETIWNTKRAKRRFRNWYRKANRDPLIIPNERYRKLVDAVLERATDDEPDYLEIINELMTPNHPLVQRAAEYEISRREEPALILAEFPEPLRRLFDEMVDAHRWGLNRAAVVLCRSLLEEIAYRAVLRTKVSVIQKGHESWLIAALAVLHKENILSDQEYSAANKIREEGNKGVHETSLGVSAWEVIGLTVDLLRRLTNRGQLSDDGKPE